MCKATFAPGSRHVYEYLISRKGSMVGDQVVKPLGIDGTAKLVYQALFRAMNTDFEAWPSLATISDAIESQDPCHYAARQRLKQLEAAGLIEDTGRLSRPGGTRVWRIHPPWAPVRKGAAAEEPTQTTLPLDEPPTAPPASTQPKRRQRKAQNEAETATPAEKMPRKTSRTPKHSEAARALVAHIRQTLPEPPACGWPRWMTQNLRAAETLLETRTLADCIACWDWARQDPFWSDRITNVSGLQKDTLWAQFRRSQPRTQTPAHQPQPEPNSSVDELREVLRRQAEGGV